MSNHFMYLGARCFQNGFLRTLMKVMFWAYVIHAIIGVVSGVIVGMYIMGVLGNG